MLKKVFDIFDDLPLSRRRARFKGQFGADFSAEVSDCVPMNGNQAVYLFGERQEHPIEAGGHEESHVLFDEGAHVRFNVCLLSTL